MQLGSRLLIDHVQTPRVEEDRVLTKIGETDLWASTLPAENRPGNLTELWQGQAFSAVGEPLTAVAFQTETDVEYVVEFKTGETWVEVERISGNGAIAVSTQSGETGTFRLAEIRPPISVPEFHHVATTAGKTNAVILGTLASDGGEATEVHVYAGATDGGEITANWEFSMLAVSGGNGLDFNAEIVGFLPGTNYLARARAVNSAGEIWSSPVPFTTLPENAPELTDIVVSNFEVDGFRISGKVALADDVTVFFGTLDGMEVPGAWQGEAGAQITAEGQFFVDVTGLEPDTDYLVRVRAKNAEFTSWSPSSLTAPTLTEVENLKHNLLISEIMYNPGWSSNFFSEPDMEFIELYNASRSPIDLSNLRFVSGINFDFDKADIQTLDPGAYGVIVANRQAFIDRYAGLNVIVLGEWLTPFRQTKLSNKGETLALQFATTGDIIHSITYDDRDPWPENSDGSGASLTLESPAPGQELNSADAWIASVSKFGTPGLRPVAEPFVVSHPQSITVEEGGTYLITAVVIGKPPITAQWLRNGAPFRESFTLSGNTAQLELNKLLVEQSGTFSLVTSNDTGSAQTDPAMVTVIPRSTDPGSLDIRFATQVTGAASELIPLPGGDLLAVGNLRTPDGSESVLRLNSNGIRDTGFRPPSVRGQVVGATLMHDGRIAIVGTMTRVANTTVPGVAVLMPDGSFDRSFKPDFSINGLLSDALVQTDGSLISIGSFVATSSIGRHNNIIRILPDGRLDASFMNSLTPLVAMTDTWRYHDKGETFGEAWRIANFDDSKWSEGPALLFVEQTPLNGPTNTPITLTRGSTTYYFRRAMWNPFGFELSVDLLLSAYADDGIVAYVNGEEIFRRRMPEGAITPETTARPKVINATAEGPFLIPRVRLIPGFNIVAAEVHQESPQSSDIVFGMSLDTPSSPGATASLQAGTDGQVLKIAAAADGKMLIGGSFSSVSGTVRRGIARLHADGFVDTTFSSSLPFTTVIDLVVQPDNRALVVGVIGGQQKLFRLMPDGSPDPEFQVLNLQIRAVALAADDSIYVSAVNFGNNVRRLHPDGTLNNDFIPDNVDGIVNELLFGSDGKLTVSGSFSNVDSVPRAGIARLFAQPVQPGGTALQVSNNLADWSADTGAVIDIHGGSIHASPVPVEGQLYFRLQGIQSSTLEPVRIEKDRVFFELQSK